MKHASHREISCHCYVTTAWWLGQGTIYIFFICLWICCIRGTLKASDFLPFDNRRDVKVWRHWKQVRGGCGNYCGSNNLQPLKTVHRCSLQQPQEMFRMWGLKKRRAFLIMLNRNGTSTGFEKSVRLSIWLSFPFWFTFHPHRWPLSFDFPFRFLLWQPSDTSFAFGFLIWPITQLTIWSFLLSLRLSRAT